MAFLRRCLSSVLGRSFFARQVPLSTKPPKAWQGFVAVAAWGGFGLLLQLGAALSDTTLFDPARTQPDFLHQAVQAEHLRKVLSGEAPGWTLLQAPYFFPFPYSAALTELGLPLVLFFSGYRALGLPILEAHFGVVLSHSLTSYGLGALLLRELLPTISPSRLGFGAFLIAFCGPKTYKLVHPHLLAQEFWLLALYALARSVRRENLQLWLLGYLALLGAVQLWVSVQVALFAGVLGSFWFGLSLVFEKERGFLTSILRKGWIQGFLGVVIASALIFPLASVFFDVRELASLLGAEARRKLLPPIHALFLPPPLNSWNRTLLGLLEGSPGEYSWEHRLGLGLGVTCLILIGLPLALKRPGWRSAWLSLGAVWLLFSRAPGLGEIWLEVSSGLAPLAVLRAPGRVWLLATPLLVATALLGLERLRQHPRSRWPVLLLVALALGEQTPLPSREAEQVGSTGCGIERFLEVKLPSNCSAFFFRSSLENRNCRLLTATVAMMRAVESGLPTLNGYSSYRPRNWQLQSNPASPTLELTQGFSAWLRPYGLDLVVCVVELETNGKTRVEVLHASSSSQSGPSLYRTGLP